MSNYFEFGPVVPKMSFVFLVSLFLSLEPFCLQEGPWALGHSSENDCYKVKGKHCLPKILL